MSNPYEDLLGRTEADAQAKSYDNLIDAQKDVQRTRLRTNMIGASELAPDTAGRALRLERTTRVPADVAARNIDEVDRQAKLNAYDALLDSSPRLAGALSTDRVFAGAAQDDLDTLAAIERTLQIPVGSVRGGERQAPGRVQRGAIRDAGTPAPTAELRAPEQLSPTPWNIIQGLGTSFAQAAEQARQGIRAQFADYLGLEDMSADALRRDAAARSRAAASTPDLRGDWTVEGIYGGYESLLRAIPALGAGVLTRSPTVGLGVLGGQTQATEYGKYRGRGGTTGEAALGATAEAAVEVATEVFPMSYLVRTMGKTGAGQFLTGLLAREMPTEQVATLVQDAIDTAIANPDKTWDDYWRERPEAAYKTALGVLVMSGTMGALNTVATRMQARSRGAEMAQANAKLLEDLSALKAASKLAGRDGVTFQRFVDAAAEEGPLTEVFVPVNALGEALKQGEVTIEDLEAKIPGFTQRFTEAAVVNGDVRLSVGEFAAHFAGTPVEQALVQELRTAPDSMSMREAEEFLQSQAQELEAVTTRTLEAAQVDDTFTKSKEAVEQSVLDQLNTAKRFTAPVNRAYAALMGNFYATMAARTGTTPEQFAAKYPIRIVAEKAHKESETVLTGGRDPRDLDFSRPELLPSGAEVRVVEMAGELRETAARMEMTPEQLAASLGNVRPGTALEDLAKRFEPVSSAALAIAKDDARFESLNTELENYKLGQDLRQAPTSGIGRKRESTSGRYVGAPERVGNSPQKLAALRKEVAQLALEGEAGRYWYENSSRAILDFVGGDRVEAEKLAALIAIYSPNATVPSNTSMALTAYYQFKAGVPIKAGFGAANAKAQAVLSGGERWSGIKTNSFYQNLMVHIDPQKLEPGVATMDMWMAIAFDYGMKAVDQGPKYMFMQREINRLAQDLGWMPHQVQAAIWTAMKARVDPIRPALRERELKLGIRVEFVDEASGKTLDKVAKGKEAEHFYLARKMGMAQAYDREAIETSKYDFSHALAERAVQISWEATPGESTGVLPGIHGATIAEKMEYLRAITEELNPGGRDLLAEAVGLPPGRNLFGWSAWEGVVGAGAQTLVAAPLEGAGGKRTFKPEAGERIKLYAAMRGYVLSRESVVWHIPVFDAAKKAENGAEIKTQNGLSPEEIKTLYGALHEKFGTWEIAPAYTRDGARVLNFVEGLSNEEFQKGVREVLEALPDDFGGGSATLKAYRSEGGAVFNNWKENFNGEGYLNDSFANRPDLQKRAADLRARVEAVNRRFADRYGWDRPADPALRGSTGDLGLAEAQRIAAEAAFGAEQLIGLPAAPMVLGDGVHYVPGPFAPAHDAAREYMRRAGMAYDPPRTYVKVDKARAARIAAEYEAMRHDPNNPEVKAAYAALAKETIEQYKMVLEAGLKVEFIDFERQGDPYAASPRLAIKDIVENNHMWVFSTRDGFGSNAALDPAENPLLAETEFKISGKPALVNDLFRVVHDYFGRVKDGAGFRADGEENAWRSHAAMFSPLARRALTTETRGQNSWVNFGPHGDKNRTASAGDTVFADQKTGLLPEWVSEDGRQDDVLRQTAAPLEAQTSEELAQSPTRGALSLGKGVAVDTPVLRLYDAADLSTFLHESGHFYLEVLAHLAAEVDAPQSVRDDMARFLQWAGVPDLATWRSWSLEQKRPAHELWARSFEAYLLEGKAPSPDIQTLFQKFRAWLLQVYRSVANLRAKLTPEISGVFDRLLATDTAIRQAEAERSLGLVFKSQEDAKMTTDEWLAYQRLGAEATEQAIDTLQTRALRDMQWLGRARSQRLREMQRRVANLRKGVANEARDEVRRDKTYAALQFLRFGRLNDGEEIPAALEDTKLSLPALKAMYGEGPAAIWRQLPTRGRYGVVSAENGMHPDVFAKAFGFSSGDQLVVSLVAARPEAEVVEALTDQRMLERHGDLTVPGALEKAVDSSLINDARLRVLATEYNALARAIGRPKILSKAARDFAERMVAGRRVRDLHPHKFEQAARRAAREADAAMAKGNTAEAATAKRNQLVNMYGTAAARRAETDVEAGLRYLRKFDNAKIRKSVDPDYVDQIDQLLERYELRPVPEREVRRRTSLARWVENQREQGMDPVVDEALLDDARRRPYQEMTVEEWRGLVDAVKNIEHLGRLKTRLLTAADQRELRARLEEAEQSIRDNARKPAQVQLERNRWRDRASRGFAEFFAVHRKFASLVREMDGHQDNGVLWKLISRPMNRAGDNEARDRAKAADALAALFKPVTKQGGLKQKLYIPEINASLSREGRLAIALNWGNEVNRQRVMEGDKWTASQVEAILRTLTRADWEFVQRTWSYLDTFWPGIAAKERRVSGIEPERVEPSPFKRTLADGSEILLSGGYYPIKADQDRSGRAEAYSAAELVKQAMQGKMTRATTRRGHTKARGDTGLGPVSKSLHVIFEHVDQVIHDLSWHEFLIDANRILRAGGLVDTAIREHYGAPVAKTMRDMLEDIAVGERGADNVFERSINHVRTGATIAGLGWNLTTSLLQPLGLTQSMVRIGPKWVAKGLWRWMRDSASFENSAAWVRERSDFMATRGKTMQREINEIRNRVEKGRISYVTDSFFWMIQKMQVVADLPTWLGQYEKSMAEGVDEATAIALADQAVLDSQGGGQIKDLARIQRGGPALKMWTNFYSFFNTTYNLSAEAIGRTHFNKPGHVGRLASDVLLLLIVPAVLSTLLKEVLKKGLPEDDDDEDDEDKLVEKIIREQLNYVFGTMVGLRDTVAFVNGVGGYTGPAGLRFFSEAFKLGKQVEQGDFDGPAFKAMNNVGGILLHYPSGQVQRTVEGVAALANGETENPLAPLVGVPGKR